MSTDNKRKVLVGFGAFAVGLIAILAIWRPPAFRSEDASGSIGTVQKYHAPQITPQDVVLGNETTRREQQIRYADFLNDAAKLHALSGRITANNFDAASREELSAMKAEVAGRWQTEAKAAVRSLNGIDFGGLRHQADANAAVKELSAILENGQLSDEQMESFTRKLSAIAEQAGIKSAAERAQAARGEAVAAIAEMRSNDAAGKAKMESAANELRAINAITLADEVEFLKAEQMESRALARDIEALGKMSSIEQLGKMSSSEQLGKMSSSEQLGKMSSSEQLGKMSSKQELGKMASRPVAENQAAARAFDGTASQLEMMAAKAMDRQLALIIVVCSAVQNIDANLAEARGFVASEASAAARGQVRNEALESASKSFAGIQTELNALANAGISAQLSAINAYIDNRGEARARTPQLNSFLASLSNALNSNAALSASLAGRQQLADRAGQLNQKASYGQKSAAY